MNDLRIDGAALLQRLRDLARIGALDGGGVCRLALDDADRAARDRLVDWMHELDLKVGVDPIGNIVGVRAGLEGALPVATGSHIDTVRTGGTLDGALGVMAGLEVVATLNRAGITTRRPIAVAAFTNEEGVRFTPDMMGSGVQQGQLDPDTCLNALDRDGHRLGDELKRIGYAGKADWFRAGAFFELHIEQGPVLETGGVRIGAVTGVQGISWTELTISGTSNHAGTTPMHLRRDAGAAAAVIAAAVTDIAADVGGAQVATVGRLELFPNLVNVVAQRAVMTVDLRNPDDEMLVAAENRLTEIVGGAADRFHVDVGRRTLARFPPVDFDPDLVDLIVAIAHEHGHSVQRMPSGAGHDAQMFVPNCPTAMIFVPSVAGLSHNINEHTAPDDIVAGADILLQAMLRTAQ